MQPTFPLPRSLAAPAPRPLPEVAAEPVPTVAAAFSAMDTILSRVQDVTALSIIIPTTEKDGDGALNLDLASASFTTTATSS